MTITVRNVRFAAAMCVCVTFIAGCATTIPGSPTAAAPDPDAAIVALMDTGDYATAASKPFGTAGEDPEAGAVLEAHRIADFTVGPWEIDEELTTLPGAIGLSQVGPITSAEELRRNRVLDGELPDIANTHRFVSGFSTVRLTPSKSGQQRGLHSAVLRFPDPAAAQAAVAEMAAKLPTPPGATPAAPVTLGIAPEARAVAFTYPDKTEQIIALTAHGPYVFYVVAQTGEAFIGLSAENLAGSAIDRQKQRIDEFTPTPLPALKDLPLDPTGQLLARTLASPSNEAPFNIGIWNARGWLHFEDNPVRANTLFNTAGVDVIAQRRATVYQAANSDGAARLADGLAEQIGSFNDVHGIDGVPGLPAATCFQRFQGALPDTAPMSWQRVVWGFKCVARVDRYAYTAFSTSAEDVRQQMAAQYRILAGQ